MVKWVQQDRHRDAFVAYAGRFHLIVHRHIHYEPDQWLASCPGVFENNALASPDIEQAKCQAVAKLQVVLEAAIKDIVSE